MFLVLVNELEGTKHTLHVLLTAGLINNRLSSVQISANMEAARAITAEFFNDSSSSDEDSGPETTMLMHEVSVLFFRAECNRVPMYVETVVPRYSEFEFQRLFRLSCATASDFTAVYAS